MTRPGGLRHKLDGVDDRLMALPGRGLTPDGARQAAITAAVLVYNSAPDADRSEQRQALAELLTALGLKDTR